MNRQVVGQASGLPRGRLARESTGSRSLSPVQRPSKLPKELSGLGIFLPYIGEPR